MPPHNIHLTETQLADRIEAEMHQPTPFELRAFRWLEKDIMRDLKRRARECKRKAGGDMPSTDALLQHSANTIHHKNKDCKL